MKKEVLIFIPSIIFLWVAMLAVVFLPARIGHHSDSSISSLRTTEMRYPTLTGYYLLTSAQKDGDTERIGTGPYQSFYVRTFALELWAIGGLLLLIEILVLRKMRTTSV